MKRWFGFTAAMVIVALAAGTVSAQDQQQQQRRGQGQGQGRGQPGGGFGGGFGGASALAYAADQKSVQEEIKMTDDQVAKAKELQTKSRESMRGLRDLSQEERRAKMEESQKANDKALGEILKPEQLTRLNQIVLQKRGGSALNDPKIQDQLKISDDQKEKLKAINEDFGKNMRELFQPGQPPSEETRAKMTEMREANNAKMLKVLTTDQQAKWKELTGAPFSGKIEAPMFRRPGGNNN